MKNRILIGFYFLALVTGAFLVNGCKDTATDPSYVALAEIRFADYHQIDPIQIFMYPPHASSTDSMSKTPTALTYGIITPYFTNLSTNRTAGETYHLVAIKAGSKTSANPQGLIVATTDVTLMPGDKKTWLIAGNGSVNGGSFDTALFNDNPPANQPTSLAYFRFVNVTPAYPQLTLMVGDPLGGMVIASNDPYKVASPYVGIPVPKSGDTSVTFYVVSGNNVLGRLAGIGLAAGTYHTVTWGGQAPGYRIPDPTTGSLTLNDTVRIRIWDDDPGTDLTVTAPLTFRFNIINALLPPNSAPGKELIDYTQPPNGRGLAIIINNNTVYDYQNLFPFSLAPAAIRADPSTDGNSNDKVYYVVPTTTPLVDKILIEMVKPAFKNPSTSDSILFRFYAGNGHPFKSDELYAIVVFDSVHKVDPKATDLAEPYDSAAGTYTVPIPDVPIAGQARIVLGYFIGYPVAPLKSTTNNGAMFFVNGVQDSSDYSTGRLLKKIGTKPALGNQFKTFDSSLVVPGGVQVILKAIVNALPFSFTFTPQSGGIYEAFLVGELGRKDDPNYSPRFIVVRINPL